MQESCKENIQVQQQNDACTSSVQAGEPARPAGAETAFVSV
jgi:hypothetical protein